MILSPADWALFVSVAFAGFVVSSALGIGGTMVLLPTLILRMTPAEAVALVAPVMLVNNLVKVWGFRHDIHRQAALYVSLTAVVGAAVGAYFTAVVDAKWLLLGIATVIFTALLLGRVGMRWTIGNRGLFFAGFVIGGASGLVGAAGAPTALAMRAYGLVRHSFVGTIAVLAVLMQVAKIPVYLSTGAMTLRLWPLAAVLSVVATAGVFVGRALLRHLDVERFKIAIDIVLFLIAVWLTLKALL